MSNSNSTSPALARRTPAHRVVTAELLAAFTRAPLGLARRVHREWFAALHHVCEYGLVAVLDRIVVGRPDPHVLETAHHVRILRRAELDGEFDDPAVDDDPDPDANRDRPDIPALAVAAMRRFQQSERLLTGANVACVVHRIVRPTLRESFDVVVLQMAAERLLADVADMVRVGPGMVVDARPREGRELGVRSWWRAA